MASGKRVLFASVLLASQGVIVRAAAQYTVTAIPTGAVALNENGTVLGEAGSIWNVNTGAQPIDAQPYNFEETYAINSSGVVAGAVQSLDGSSPYGSQSGYSGAAAFGSGSGVTLLPPLSYGPYATAVAYGINNSNVVVGASGSSADHQQFSAVRWTNGVAEDLSVYLNPTGGSSYASSVNNVGQVVITQGTQSYVLTGNQLTPITASDSSATATYGGAINDNGQMEGVMYLQDGTAESFIWSSGQMKVAPSPFPGLPGMTEFGAINNEGAAVGFYSSTRSSNTIAIMWDGSGNTVDLNSLIDPSSDWYLYNATGINDSGDIVGNGLLNGVPTAFLLTPSASPSGSSSVPEPASAATLGVAGLLLLRRRRRA